MKNIRVVAYDPAWPAAFEQEAALLAGILGGNLVTIHHIDSTSIPGLPAKAVIDMMPLVRDIAGVDRLAPRMAEAGYDARGESGISGHRLFTKGGDVDRLWAQLAEGGDGAHGTRRLPFQREIRLGARRVMQVFLQMKKIDTATLRMAYEGR